MLIFSRLITLKNTVSLKQKKTEAAKKYKKNINIIQGEVKLTYFLRNQLDP